MMSSRSNFAVLFSRLLAATASAPSLASYGPCLPGYIPSPLSRMSST